jgi:hypothetical protein
MGQSPHVKAPQLKLWAHEMRWDWVCTRKDKTLGLSQWRILSLLPIFYRAVEKKKYHQDQTMEVPCRTKPPAHLIAVDRMVKIQDIIKFHG